VPNPLHRDATDDIGNTVTRAQPTEEESPGGALGMVTTSCSTSGDATTPNTDGGNDAPRFRAHPALVEEGMAAAASIGTSSSTSATASGVARFQPPRPPAPPKAFFSLI
jgi:hypothetical protein